MDTFPEQCHINRKVNRRDLNDTTCGCSVEENRRHDEPAKLMFARLVSFVNWHARITSSRCDSRRFYDRFGVDASQRDGRANRYTRDSQLFYNRRG